MTVKGIGVRRWCCRLVVLGFHVGVLLTAGAPFARAEVTCVTIISRSVVAGASGSERLAPTSCWSVGSSSPSTRRRRHNSRIADLAHARRGPDGRVHFSGDVQVLRPVDESRANLMLLFDIPNRGNRVALGRLSRDPGRRALTDMT